jgi:uncharacterized protein (TIGR02246 family)
MSPGPFLKRARIVAAILLTAACRSQPAANPNDPEIVAAVEAILDKAVAAAAAADAEGALSAAARDDSFTFISGDTMLTGYDQALAAFRTTYAQLQKQTNEVITKRVRVLAADVVLVTAISEGTYTDKAGFTSPLVGLGSTAVFVRQNGQWRVVHYHQSVARQLPR